MKSMYFVGLGLCLSLLFACKKDEGPSNCAKLEGKWQLASWMEDGIQLFGDTIYITSAELEFKVLTGEQGDYTLTTNYLIGGMDMIIGAYVVNTDCNQVTLTPKGGAAGVLYDFHFESNKLVLDGTDNSVVREIQLLKE